MVGYISRMHLLNIMTKICFQNGVTGNDKNKKCEQEAFCLPKGAMELSNMTRYPLHVKGGGRKPHHCQNIFYFSFI
jgi:hypothetical protein